ncbi:hypothetical protein PQX77_010513 [Marasmius sp. AFHP31]|nr:hypothetical protein PQX77_010513 [Marasmius sp. AFHP31]
MVTTIHGNQINNVMQPEKREPTEFDDFRIVKRGDICREQDVVQFVLDDYMCLQRYIQDCRCESCQGQAIKTVCIGKVEGTRGKFTVMSYSGPGGRKAFEEDFRKFSSVGTTKVPQMYAVDIGSVPSILYWNELVPAVVLMGNVGLLGRRYLSSLRQQWGCAQGELWMDPKRGMICHGPEGPFPNFGMGGLDIIENMPSTVDLLQEDICLRFMASCKSREVDHIFVAGIRSARRDVVVPESFDQPTVISALTQTPIAVGNNIWDDPYGDFVERKVLESGLIRSVSWSTKSYKQLDEYQRLHGFDPTTTDFARHLGYTGNIFHPVDDTNRFHEDYEDQHFHCPKSPPDLCCDQINSENNMDQPVNQRRCVVERFDNTLAYQAGELKSSHITAKGKAGVEGMDYRVYTEQNLHLGHDACDRHIIVEPCIQQTPPLLRRYTSNHSSTHMGYPPTTDPLLTHRTAPAEPHENRQNSFLPSYPESLPTTNLSFNVIHRIMTTASTTAQTEGSARQALKTPQDTIAAVSSHGTTFPSPQWDAYASAPVTNGFPHSTLAPMSSLSSPSNIYAIGHAMPIPREHSPQTIGSSGMSQFDRGGEHHHHSTPVTSPDAFPMSAYAPAVGYPTNPPPIGSLPEMLPTAGYDYRLMPSDGLCDTPPMVHNTGYQTDNGGTGTARGIGACSEDEQESHLVTSISGISNNHGTYAREAGSAAVLEATDDRLNQPVPSSSQPDVEELCGNGFDCLSQRGDIRDGTQGTDAILGPNPTPDSSFRHAGVDLPTSSARNEEPEEILDSVPAIASERSDGLSLNGNIPNVAVCTSSPNASVGPGTNLTTDSDRRLGEPSSGIDSRHLHKLKRDLSSVKRPSERLPSLLANPRGASKSPSTPEAARTNVYVHRRERDRGRDSASDVIRRLCSRFSLG